MQQRTLSTAMASNATKATTEQMTATNIILRTAVERWLTVGYKRFDFDFKRIRTSRRNSSYVELQTLSTFTCSCKLRTHTLPSDALQRAAARARRPAATGSPRHAPSRGTRLTRPAWTTPVQQKKRFGRRELPLPRCALRPGGQIQYS